MSGPAADRPLAVGDVVLIRAEISSLGVDGGSLVVAISGYESGMVTYTPVPRRAVHKVLVRADPR
jgi:hypothetical protein